MRPLIALGGRRFPAGWVKAWPTDEAVAVPSPYINALRRAGADAGILQPVPADDGDLADLLDRFDGLVLIGGPDVDPSLYGRDQHPECYGIDRDRDEFELALARMAIDRDVPVLAICRGIQLVNVALGGTLDQHISEREGVLPHGNPTGGEGITHPIDLEPGSLVATAMGVERAEGFSHHHQAIDDLGEGLRAVGRTEDGIIEAVELEDGWLLGVQWHPEETAAFDRAHQGLFDALAERARDPGARVAQAAPSR
jgi:putative glutamine amidotransferase